VRIDPKSIEIQLSCQYLFLGSACVKAAYKMLVKLTPGVKGSISSIFTRNFFVQKRFVHKSAFCNFSPITVWLCDFLAQKYWRKNIGAKILAQKLLLKCWWNWLQVSISSTFYTRFFHMKFVLCSFSLLTVWLCSFLAKKYWRKAAHKILMKLTTGIRMKLELCYFTSLHS